MCSLLAAVFLSKLSPLHAASMRKVAIHANLMFYGGLNMTFHHPADSQGVELANSTLICTSNYKISRPKTIIDLSEKTLVVIMSGRCIPRKNNTTYIFTVLQVNVSVFH